MGKWLSRPGTSISIKYKMAHREDIYSAGTVHLDSTPYLNYFLQKEARKQAKDEAFLKSFQNMSANVTTAGMANNDISAFMEKKNAWQNFTMQNKDAYENPIKDNGRAYGQAMAMYNDMLNHAQSSRNKLRALSPLGQVLQNPDRNKLISEQTMMDYHNGSLPVTDPNYRQFDVGSIDFNPKPFDETMQNRYWDAIRQNVKRDKVVSNVEVDPKTRSKTTTYVEQLSKDSLPLLQERAATLYGTNASAANFFDHELSTPSEYNKFNNIFKNSFGRDIESGEDMPAAWTLGSLQQTSQQEKITTYAPPQPKSAGSRRKGSATSKPNEGVGLVNQIADAIQSNDQSALNTAAGNLFKGNGSVKFIKAEIGDNGRAYFNVKVQKKGRWINQVISANPNDPNLRNGLAGFVQKVMGADKKLEDATYSNEVPVKSKKSLSGITWQ